tara:strand:- start:37 stop:384 length:348 start_codon:yes stop_codon:yes gene_type:complete
MNEYLHHDFSEGWDDLKYYTTKEVAEILGIDRIDLLKTMLEGFHITYFDKDNLFANYVDVHNGGFVHPSTDFSYMDGEMYFSSGELLVRSDQIPRVRNLYEAFTYFDFPEDNQKE